MAHPPENFIREKTPRILEILLLDRTRSTPEKPRNIIWANDNYVSQGRGYAATDQITPGLIAGANSSLIMPRALKTKELKKERTRTRAEVFTPPWIVKKQIDAADENYQNDDLETYIKRKWLEIACGEAPYVASRYDMNSGEIIPLAGRTGFLDRKLARINAEVGDKAEWQRLVAAAYKASYGFEWNGDSLLLARENLLYTYRDYYRAKWKANLIYGLFKEIAVIISYNIFQMDGLKFIIPFSEKKLKVKDAQLALFGDMGENEKWIISPGRRVKIMNWDSNCMEYFDKDISRNFTLGGKK
jgi:hypothetical protein